MVFFSRDELRSLNTIKDILIPFRAPSKLLEGENASAGHVIPVVRLVYAEGATLKNKYNGNTCLGALVKAMDKRLAQYDLLAETPLFQICSFVDPWIKAIWCCGKYFNQFPASASQHKSRNHWILFK